ncbi:MAG: hypothetical protein N2316_07275, partial [Spirochaetes bacterium]|nr:hypothetical protein [Spirochaetota bacterium]
SIVYTAYVEFIKRSSLHYYVHEGFWHDIGTFKSLLVTNMDMLARKSEAQKLLSPLGIGIEEISKTATIHRDAKIENSVIGDFAYIEKNAHLLNSVALPFSRVKENSTISNAVLYEDMALSE